MAGSRPGQPKGRTGNPNGRPIKERTLTVLLEKAMEEVVKLPNGTEITGKDLVSKMVAEAVSTGQVNFPFNTGPTNLSTKDWLDFVKWFYSWLDPKDFRVGVKDQTGKVVVEVVYASPDEETEDSST